MIADAFSAIANRRSTRNFSPRDIPEKLLLDLLHLANRAPSSFNIQPWHFVVVRDQNLKKLLRRVAMNQKQVTDAPVTVVFVADPEVWRSTYRQVLSESARQGLISQKQLEGNRKSVDLFFRTGPIGLYGLAKRIAVPVRRLFAPTPGLVTSKFEATQYVRGQTMLSAATFMIAASGAGLVTSPMEGFDEYRLKRLLAIPFGHTVPIIIAVGYPPEGAESRPSFRLPLAEKISWDLFGRRKHEL
jgi:nitroreductase